MDNSSNNYLLNIIFQGDYFPFTKLPQTRTRIVVTKYIPEEFRGSKRCYMLSMKLIRIPQYLGKNDRESRNTISIMKSFETFL